MKHAAMIVCIGNAGEQQVLLGVIPEKFIENLSETGHSFYLAHLLVSDTELILKVQLNNALPSSEYMKLLGIDNIDPNLLRWDSLLHKPIWIFNKNSDEKG